MVDSASSAVVELTGLDTVQRFAGSMVELREDVGAYARGEALDPTPTTSVTSSHRKPRGPLVAAAIRRAAMRLVVPHGTVRFGNRLGRVGQTRAAHEVAGQGQQFPVH